MSNVNGHDLNIILWNCLEIGRVVERMQIQLCINDPAWYTQSVEIEYLTVTLL